MPGKGFIDKRVSRDSLGKLRPWIARERRQLVQWRLDESLTEDELVALARRYPESSQLLQTIAMHPNTRARGLRVIASIALERGDDRALNGVVTLAKTPIDVLRKLRRHSSASVREHVRANLADRGASRGRPRGTRRSSSSGR